MPLPTVKKIAPIEGTADATWLASLAKLAQRMAMITAKPEPKT